MLSYYMISQRGNVYLCKKYDDRILQFLFKVSLENVKFGSLKGGIFIVNVV